MIFDKSLILEVLSLCPVASLCSLNFLKLFLSIWSHSSNLLLFSSLLLFFLMLYTLVSYDSMLHFLWCVAVNFAFVDELSFLLDQSFLLINFRCGLLCLNYQVIRLLYDLIRVRLFALSLCCTIDH